MLRSSQRDNLSKTKISKAENPASVIPAGFFCIKLIVFNQDKSYN